MWCLCPGREAELEQGFGKELWAGLLGAARGSGAGQPVGPLLHAARSPPCRRAGTGCLASPCGWEHVVDSKRVCSVLGQFCAVTSFQLRADPVREVPPAAVFCK